MELRIKFNLLQCKGSKYRIFVALSNFPYKERVISIMLVDSTHINCYTQKVLKQDNFV